MTNALVVLWEVKVSEEAGTSQTPADMSHEDTGVLDATLPVSICKLAQHSNCLSNLSNTTLRWAEGAETSWTLVRRGKCSRTDLLVSLRGILGDIAKGERTAVDASDASAVTDPKVYCVRAST